MKKCRLSLRTILLVTVMLIAFTGCKEKSTDINIEDIDLDVSQTYFKDRYVAKGEQGYYYLDNWGEYILYFDEATKEVIPLCSKAECTHDGKDCMAYVKDVQIDFQVYYYAGKLYWLTTNDGMTKLMECGADGSDRKIIGELYPFDTESSEADLMFAGGNVYFTENGNVNKDSEKSIFLKKMSLNTGAVESVYEYIGTNCSIQKVKAYSDNVYFVIYESVKNGERTVENRSKGLYMYNNKNGKTELIVDGSVRDYCIDTKNKALYYYVHNKGLYKSENGEKKLIYTATEQTGFCELTYDGQYVYMDNSMWKKFSKLFMGLDYDITSTIWVFDGGTLKTTIDIDKESVKTFCNGDSNYFFVERKQTTLDEENVIKGYSLFSKKEFFETGKINWIEGDYERTKETIK